MPHPRPFEACPSIDFIQLVVGQEDMTYTLQEIVEAYGYRKVSQIVPGGKLRQESVKKGIDTLSSEVDIVAIHDGVRPFVTQRMIEESIQGARQFKAVVLAMPVKETIKMAGPDRTVLKTLDRESLWQIQTPQTFQAGRHPSRPSIRPQRKGSSGRMMPPWLNESELRFIFFRGSYTNIKITTPEDLILGHLILKMGASLERESL